MVKEAKIQYYGKEETIQLEDNPLAEVIMPILKRCMKTKVGQTQPEIDAQEWFIGIATNLVISAPWGNTKDVTALRKLPYKTYAQLEIIIGDEFPLKDFLYPELKLLYGKLLDSVESASQTESTTSLPSGESLNFK